MLTPQQIERLPDSLIRLYAQVESDILASMARRIGAQNMLIPAAEYQYVKSRELGLLHDEIVKRLSRALGMTTKELETLLKGVATTTMAADNVFYRVAGLKPKTLAASPGLQRILSAGLEQTIGLFENLTQTTARTATGQFERAMDRAWLQVQSGAFSHTEAVKSAIKGLAEKGVGVIEYPSGHIDYMDTAVRRAALTGVNATSIKVSLEYAKEMGAKHMELTAHSGARPEHEEWQGQIVSLDGEDGYLSLEDIGYGTGDGFGGWNCRHSWHPWFPGMPRAYTQEILASYKEPRYEYNGRKMTEYEAVSRQRYIERQIRRWRREEAAMKAAGMPTDKAAGKVKQWNDTMKDFTEQTGLKRQPEREKIPKVQTRTQYRGTVDITDKTLVESRIRAFESWAVKQPTEQAYVVLESGKTYLFQGDHSSVHPEKLGKALEGSTVSHNHPARETEYSFSREDLELLAEYGIKTLRGIDLKYEYVIENLGCSLNELQEVYTQAKQDARSITSLGESEEQFLHNVNDMLCKLVPLRYERKLRL